MTRKQAKKFKWYQNDRENIEIHIDKIYDDFESRTCKNCVHEIGCVGYVKCNLRIPRPELYQTRDFGCNKFEAKDAN